MSDTTESLADQLMKEFAARGLPADRYNPGPGSAGAGVNVWAPAAAVTEEDPNLNRYPQASILVSDSGRFHDISWGPNWEHALPLTTPPEQVVEAVIKTLPESITLLLPEVEGS